MKKYLLIAFLCVISVVNAASDVYNIKSPSRIGLQINNLTMSSSNLSCDVKKYVANTVALIAIQLSKGYAQNFESFDDKYSVTEILEHEVSNNFIDTICNCIEHNNPTFDVEQINFAFATTKKQIGEPVMVINTNNINKIEKSIQYLCVLAQNKRGEDYQFVCKLLKRIFKNEVDVESFIRNNAKSWDNNVDIEDLCIVNEANAQNNVERTPIPEEIILDDNNELGCCGLCCWNFKNAIKRFLSHNKNSNKENREHLLNYNDLH